MTVPVVPATFSGWWAKRDRWGQRVGYEAYIRDEGADRFDLYPASEWWVALGLAMELAAKVPGCTFEGGPERE